MLWVIGLLAVGVLGVAVIATTGRLGEMPDQVDDRPGPDLPAGPWTGQDLRQARFAVVTRGYSMQQVDALLDRVGLQLDGLCSDDSVSTQSGVIGAAGPELGGQVLEAPAPAVPGPAGANAATLAIPGATLPGAGAPLNGAPFSTTGDDFPVPPIPSGDQA